VKRKAPQNSLGQGAEQLFGEVHQVFIGGVGLIKLQHGEFRVVEAGEAFVPEIAVDFIDPVKAPHQEALQIKLRRDAQIQLHVQGLMMGGEGFGRGPARDGLHHGGLHFEEAPLVQELAHDPGDGRPGAEDLPDRGIHQQVEVALAVAGLHVGEAVVFFRQGAQGLGEELKAAHLQGEFPGFGAKQRALKTHQVAHV
jgi:hypothetical protein